MSAVFTGTNQGRFLSNGQSRTISLRSDFDWIKVYNETVLIANAPNRGAEFYFQRGMTNGRGLIYTKTAANLISPSQIAANAGFFEINSTINNPGPQVAITGVNGDNPPKVLTANTGSLAPGDIVRMYNPAGALQLAGYDFTVGLIDPGVSFELGFMAPIVATGAINSFFRRIPFDPYYYPRARSISAISQAQQAVVQMTVTHNLTIGQQVRFVVPAEFGMFELNNLEAPIVAVNTVTNTITVDLDTTGFTAFAFPLSADFGFSKAEVIPQGEDTAVANDATPPADAFAGARTNTGILGVRLIAGDNSPAGNDGDTIYWVAGKSFGIYNN